MQPGALPDREIRVLHRQLRQGRRPARGEGRIERRDLADQDAHGPAVAGDVVQGQRDDVVPLGEAQQQAAQQRTAAEIERAGGLFPDQGEGQRLARRSPAAPTGPPRAAGRAPPAGSPGPASPPARRRPCATPRAGARSPRGRAPAPRRPAALRRAAPRHVVERAARFELIDEPEPLLRERQGQSPLAQPGTRGTRGGVSDGRAGPPRRFDPGGEVRQPSGPRRGRAAAPRRPRRRAGATSPGSPAASGPPGRRSGRPPRPARARAPRPRCRRGPLRPACAAPGSLLRRVAIPEPAGPCGPPCRWG